VDYSITLLKNVLKALRLKAEVLTFDMENKKRHLSKLGKMSIF
jgi:hypothetical protein